MSQEYIFTPPPKNEEFEVICINDGSTDATLSILEKWSREKDNFVLLTHDNMGSAATRNRGIEIAKGDYIWCVDGDDMILPNALKLIMEQLKEHAPEIVIMKNYTRISNDTRLEGIKKIDSLSYVMERSSLTSNSVSSCVYKLAKENRIYFEPRLKYAEDTYYNYLHYLALVERENGCVAIETPLYCYRQNPNSVMNTKTREATTRHATDLFLLGWLYKQKLDNNEIQNPEKVKNTKIRQPSAILGGLELLPRTSLDLNQTLAELKKHNLYPLPWITWRFKSAKTFQSKVREGLIMLLKAEWIYRIFYKSFKK